MWAYGNYGNELQITKAQAQQGSHQGQCDDDIEALCQISSIKRQLRKLDPEKLRLELKEFGAWDAEELADHEQNLRRWLWICCGNITEEIRAK